MNKVPLISIITPIYNSRLFLSECINSILNQSFTDFELILVDDGSTDGSNQICDKYANNDTRIKVIHQTNSGSSIARQSGIKHSNGKYICFIDSDDTIDKDYLKILSSGIKPDCQIVCVEKDISTISWIEYLKGLLVYRFGWEMWNKLYLKEILDVNFFNLPKELKIGEDLVTNVLIAQKVKFVSTVPYAGYNYRDNQYSLMHSRKITYEYETFLQDMLDKAMCDNLELFIQELWHNKMVSWKLLVYNNIQIPANSTWINWCKNYSKNITSKSSIENILLKFHNNRIRKHLIDIINFKYKLIRKFNSMF